MFALVRVRAIPVAHILEYLGPHQDCLSIEETNRDPSPKTAAAGKYKRACQGNDDLGSISKADESRSLLPEDFDVHQLLVAIAMTRSDPRRVPAARADGSSPVQQTAARRHRSFVRSTEFYAFSVLLKWSMVRCQASLAALSSKRGVVSLWKP